MDRCIHKWVSSFVCECGTTDSSCTECNILTRHSCPKEWKKAGIINRGEVLDEAKRLTYGDRNVSYDEPRINHKRIGVILGIVLERYVEQAQPGDPVPPEVAALCMAAMKLARLSAKPNHLDSAIDLAAYAAICAELAQYID